MGRLRSAHQGQSSPAALTPALQIPGCLRHTVRRLPACHMTSTTRPPPAAMWCALGWCHFARLSRFLKIAFLLAQETDQSFELTYGTGAVEGYVSFDTMSIGTPPISISNQGFGQAIDLTPDFVTTSCDGLFVRFLNFCRVSAVTRPCTDPMLTS